MSYILDALNKTEQATRNQQSPKLDSVQMIPQHPNTGLWFFVLVVAVVVSSIIIWYLPKETAPIAVTSRTQTSTGNVEPVTQETQLVRLSALPISVQNKIPSMTFSSHIYASDQSLRMVTINNQLYREGDTIAGGIKLKAISEDGIVLRYQHYIIEMSILHDWSNDN